MTQAKFKFVSDVDGGDQFTVVSFTGSEHVSELYRYEIEVKAPLSANIDLDDVLDSPARFVTEQNGLEFPVNGILSSFEEFKTVQNHVHFKAVLVPKIWKLSNYKTNEIFYKASVEGELDGGQTIAEIISQVLDKSGMISADYDIEGLSGHLLKREYVCQFNESDFDFISRLLENEGVFYYFEQSDTEEKIVFVNDLNYLSIPRPKLLFDVAAMSKTQDDCVFGWSCRKQRLPQRVVVRDYNAEESSLDVSDTTAIDSMGQGTEYIYGKNVKTDSEATYLSQIRAEEHISRKTQFFGESSVTRLQAGYIFLLDQHPNIKYNESEYFLIEVSHEGHGLDMSISQDGQKGSQPQYQNSFVAISADTQYRPPLKTKKPKITGTLHARIDGEQDSEYAQLDSQGRYKISLPFDFHNDEHPEGLASARVRMMQPYAGENRGMQFPMAKGTEVLLSFVDGDPDRPIIAGAINTAAAPGPVTADNQTEAVIQTAGNNKIRMEDKFGSERIMLESPAANSWIRVGATNDPIILRGDSPQYVDIGSRFEDLKADSTDSTVTPPIVTELPVSETYNTIGEVIPEVNTSAAGEYIQKYVSGSDSAYRRVIVCDLETQNDLIGSTSDGIRIRSAGNLWFEGRSRYGDYYLAPSALEGASLARGGGNSIGDLYDKFTGSAPSYAPTMKNMAGGNLGSFKQNVLPNARLRVSSLDTVTTQEGNIYDFGGYWNYNLGNSYAEDHIKQDASAELNADHRGDLLDLGGPDFTGWSEEDITDEANPLANTKISKNSNITMQVDSTPEKKPLIWVQKSFGDSYEYKSGNAISVTLGSTQDIEIGGVHVEEAYRGDGSIKSRSTRGIDLDPAREEKWNKNGKRTYLSETTVTEDYVNDLEQKFDRRTGALYSDTRSQGTGMGLSKFEFDYSNTVSMVINTGSVVAMESFLGGKMTMDNFVGGKMHMENFLGGAMTMENAVGIIMKMENAPLVFKNVNGSVESNIPGFKVKAEASETTVALNAMKSSLSDINSPLFASLTAGLTSIA